MSEIITPSDIKENFKKKLEELIPRLNQVIDNTDVDNNIESFTKVYENLLLIESQVTELENRMDVSNLDNIEERNRIIDQKVLKLFSPFILYYKLCLLQNNNLG